MLLAGCLCLRNGPDAMMQTEVALERIDGPNGETLRQAARRGTEACKTSQSTTSEAATAILYGLRAYVPESRCPPVARSTAATAILHKEHLSAIIGGRQVCQLLMTGALHLLTTAHHSFILHHTPFKSQLMAGENSCNHNHILKLWLALSDLDLQRATHQESDKYCE